MLLDWVANKSAIIDFFPCFLYDLEVYFLLLFYNDKAIYCHARLKTLPLANTFNLYIYIYIFVTYVRVYDK